MLINKCSQVKIETGLTKLKRTKINELKKAIYWESN